jgi:UDP-N-acetylglucosamine 2-epimerase (non-hydrolysing)
MRAHPSAFEVRVAVTAQHRGLLDQVLEIFRITPDRDLNVMQPGQTLFQTTARVLLELEPLLAEEKADIVVVQGDTTTTMAASLAAFYQHIPVAHVEAGLRTGNLRHPFPEEMNRLLTTRLAALHFAPTEWAAENLRREGTPAGAIFVTGNTGVDAVLHVVAGLDSGELQAPAWPWLDGSRRLVLVTAHRRESFGPGIERICRALETLASRPDVQVAYPVHPNPNVDEPVRRLLAGRPNITLLDPLSYVAFVDLMRRAHLLLTDSGGVQEEAPSLGKPVLVMRETTERPEAVEAGAAVLVGSDPERIAGEVSRLLEDRDLYGRRCLVHNPFGDGHSSGRISDLIHSFKAE